MDVAIDDQPGCGRWCGGQQQARGEPQHRQCAGDQRRLPRRDHARQQLPAQDREERPRLDHAGAAHDLVGAQVLGQDRIFGRAEDRRMHPHQEQRGEQQRHRFDPEADQRDEHDRDLGELDHADQPGLVPRIGNLAGKRGEEEIGQDEQPGRDRRELRGLARIGGVKPEIGEEQQRELEQIVVEGAQELHDEQRREAARAEQRQIGC